MNCNVESLRLCPLQVQVADCVGKLLDDIQINLYKRALAYRDKHTTEANCGQEFDKLFDQKSSFVSAHWEGEADSESTIKEKTKAFDTSQ